MAYRRAISSLGCPDLTVEQALDFAARHGLEGIELRAAAGSIDLVRYLAEAYGSPGRLAEAVRGRPTKLCAIDTSFRLIGHAARDREELLALTDWAEALGGLQLRVFDGGTLGGESELAEAAAVLAWWSELRASRRWKTDLMVETHDSLWTIASVQRLLQLAPSGTSILWDVHNMWRRSGEDPLVVWRAIGRSVTHVHVKDSVARRDAPHGFEYVLPGEGEFPAKPLMSVLRAEFGGVVSLEWERLWVPDLAPLDEVLAAANRNDWW